MLDNKFWEKYFKVYDVLNIVNPYIVLLNELEKELDLNQNDIVLDIGSGTGNLMIIIKGKCKKIIGLDFSEEGIKIHKNKDPLADSVVCDITKGIPFSDNYFTKVVSNNTIYTLNYNQQKKLLFEIKRVLKPGGKLVVSNVKKGFSPFRIYTSHIAEHIKREGFLKTFISLINLLEPTIKMFYYNAKIKKSDLSKDYNFFNSGEKKKILEDSAFINISEERLVYAGQAIMNSCYKP